MVAKGRSAHAASNHLGDNALYKLLPIIASIRDLEPQLGDHEFLGHGKITVTDLRVQTASINAVPDEAKIFIDRRMTLGETREEVMAQIEDIIPNEHRSDVSLNSLFYDEPSYTGFVFPVEKRTTISLVEVSESTVIALKVVSIFFFNNLFKTREGISASVNIYPSVVAMFGKIIPDPLAIP